MKLARMITDNIPRKLPGAMHENHMDFWILDRLLTKREVAFMLSFKKRRVGLTTAELAKRNHISEEKAQKIIDHLLWIGILEQNRDNEDHHIQYCVPKWVVGSGEYMVEHKTLPDEHPEVATMFNLAPQEPPWKRPSIPLPLLSAWSTSPTGLTNMTLFVQWYALAARLSASAARA